MAWIVQSASEGPIVITDMGITLTKNQVRDLDIIGRQNAERSTDIQYLLQKGFIRTIRKDASPSMTPEVDPKIMADLKLASEQITAAAAMSEEQAKAAKALQEQNLRLQAQLEEQKKQLDEGKKQSGEIAGKQDQILAEIKAFAQRDPLGIKAIKEALENIKAEKLVVVERRAEIAKEIKAADEVTERELKTQDNILKLKESKLDRNFEDLGKTVSQKAESVQESINALDEMGI